MTRKYRRIFAATLAAAGTGVGTIASGPAAAHTTATSAEQTVLGAEHAAAHARKGKSAHRLSSSSAKSVARLNAAGPPSSVGAWAPPIKLPKNVMGIHATMLPTGKVLWFGTQVNPSPKYNHPGSAGSIPVPNAAGAALWDSTTGRFTRINPPINPDTGLPTNIWCAGQSLLSDGSVLVTGGNLEYSPPADDYKGLNTVLTFDPFAERWIVHPRMRDGRWYPSQVLLQDGTTIITSGKDASGKVSSDNLDIERFTPGSTRSTPGTVQVIGTRVDTRTGTQPDQPPNGGLYPHHFLMPSGKVLTAGPFPEDTWELTSPTTSTAFRDIPNLAHDRLWGTGVLVPQATPGTTRVMLLGGAGPPIVTPTVNTTEVYDENNPSLKWQAAANLNVGRGHHNTVLLPDGSMVTVGGGVGEDSTGDLWAVRPDHAERQVELWNPTTGKWTLGPAQAEDRVYHSTAVLLPDGRVVSAGDDVHGGIDQDTYETYSPPYLFKGPRPEITFAPSEVRYGASFSVGSPDTNVTKAVMMAPSATTHNTDMSQRHVPVSITKRADGRGYDLTAPSGPTIAPPGYYMLFLLNAKGVPSVAEFIRVHPQAPDAPPIRPPGSKIGSRVALGSFEAKRLAPWARQNAAARVGGGSDGGYSVRLTGARRKPAILSRVLPRVAPGRYALVFSVRDGRALKVVRTAKSHEVRLAPRRQGWRTTKMTLHVKRNRRLTLRFRIDQSRATRVDNVYLIRVS